MLNTVAATAAAGFTIICPEYSLAPEHPFPRALDEVLIVYKTMIGQHGYNPKNIVFLGDSAGGGMVAAAAVQLQQEGVALPAALGMFSPWADLTVRGDSVATLNGVDPVLPGRDPSVKKPGLLLTQAGAYTRGKISEFSNPLVSPVYADYAAMLPAGALPPTMIQVGLREVLLSDAVRLYHKMKQAAPAPGHVVLSPYEGMWHVFQSYIDVPEAQAASREMAEYFMRALNGNVCK
jgi:acetyl esterase/lipase